MKNEHKFTFENNVIKLLVTNSEPPRKRHPEDSDILVHVKNEEEMINEDVLDKLDQATDVIRKKYSRNTDEELDTHKLRISKHDIYIRDETKDNLILGTVLYILDHVSDAVDKLLDEKTTTNNVEKENPEENETGYSEESEEVEVYLPEEKSSKSKEEQIKHQSRFDISSVNLKEEQHSDDPSEMVDMLLQSRK